MVFGFSLSFSSLSSIKKIRPKRRKKASSRNPMKTMSVEVKSEYTQVNTGAAEKLMRKMKTEGCKFFVHFHEPTLL
jgi:hypothetical protein